MIRKTTIAIGLGSNLGDRAGTIQEAVTILKGEFLENPRLSAFYETEPWGITDQPKFVNAVLVGECGWRPAAIINYLKSVEKSLGRVARMKNGPREIDLDLLAFGNDIVESEGVTVPHPGISERDFVLVPFADIWPEWLHPVLKKTVNELKEALLKSHPSLIKIFTSNDLAAFAGAHCKS